eukprot:9611201-Alexandrium_andersonii.AAC.1
MWNCSRRSELELRGPRSGLNIDPPKLWRCEFCHVFRADAESVDEAGQRERQRRFLGGGHRLTSCGA